MVMDDVSKPRLEERNFHHPYEPYEIQKEFMNAVYDCLEHGKVGIFESPTGTGKSLSLICGSLTWLRDHNAKQIYGEEGVQLDNDTPKWMLEYEKEEKRRSMFQRLQEHEEKLAQIQAKEDRARSRYERDENPSKKRKTAESTSDDLGEAQFLLDDYESDQDRDSKTNKGGSTQLGLSEETQKLMTKLAGTISQRETDVEAEEETKIIYCSRTHSQLTQFAQELGRVKMPSNLPDLDSKHAQSLVQRIKYVTLGSRKNLCINPKVSKLASSTAINERCLELQQPGTSSHQKCSHLPNKDSEALVHDFRDYTMARIRDIEDLGNLGRKMHVCPYYASRAAIKPAEIVTVPYPMLLQKSTRETLNLSLKGHVVIIDEAHNLMDAVSNLHSAHVSLDELSKSRAQLGIYVEKFRTRLKGKNRVYIAQLVRVLDSLSSYLESKAKAGTSSGIVRVVDLMAGKGADQINLHKLVHYLNESKLARKVDRYIVHTENLSPEKANKASTPLLIHIQGFLHALSNPEAEGRFFYLLRQPGDGAPDEITLEYMLLDPTHHFKEIVEEARAVILAGGTMSPMGDYTDFLLDYVSPKSLLTLSCGHVIPPSNLLAFPQSEGPTGVTLDFSFANQKSPVVITELGKTILELAKIIPDGLVVFFPSYALLSNTTQHWQKTKLQHDTLWDAVSANKRIFLESQSREPTKGGSTKNNTETLLAEYSAHIDAGHGALLLAVMGGSLSEGINFADGLGRGVVVVGMPYPNPHTPEWKARLEYVEQRNRRIGGRDPKAASRDYYENVCMRSVNQTIGRAIRHRNDYATIALLDQRYRRPHVKNKLPAWIQGSLTSFASFSQARDGVRSFFKEKQVQR